MLSSVQVSSLRPNLEDLSTGLSAILDDDSGARLLRVIHRNLNAYTSTYDSEVVTCRFADGSERQLFCKYGSDGIDDKTARQGIPYEAEVYKRVLRGLDLTTPQYLGVHRDKAAGITWLVLDYLAGSSRLAKAAWSGDSPEKRRPLAMWKAAHWLGHFHAINETVVASPSVSFLNTLDSKYYRSLAHQSSLIAKTELKDEARWLTAVAEWFAYVGAHQLELNSTIIHGEFFPENILYRNRYVYPVDWERAAVASGAIDLASLVQAWPHEVVVQCETEYIQTRWPSGAPANLQETLIAARLYWYLGWLSRWCKQDLTERRKSDKSWKWLIAQLENESQRLGLF